MKHLKTLGILFSLVLNLVLIGGRLYAWRTNARQEPRAQDSNPYLWKRLALRSDQITRFQAACKPFRERIRRQGQQIKAKRLALLDLLASHPSDQPAIQRVVGEIQTLQHQMQSMVIRHLLRESQVFTQAQRAQFFALLKERMRASRLPQPSWMPRGQ